MPISALVQRRVDQSASLGRWINSHVDGKQLYVSHDRVQVCAGLLHIALNHHHGIVVLISNELPSSAAALMRVIVETYVKAVWLRLCSSERQFKRFLKDKEDTSFGDMVREIEKREEFNQGVLSRFKERFWRVLNSYTHSGMHQIVRHLKEGGVETNFSDDEMLEMLQTCDLFCILATMQIANLTNDAELGPQLLEKMEALQIRPGTNHSDGLGE